jgi:uncharacterized protein YecT (DUF1311 family)
MLVRMLAVLLLLLLGLPAQAASFDCAQASTPLERLICGDAELSANDAVLAKAYATALGGLSDSARATMQSNQRAWLAYAALACTHNAVLPAEDYPEEARDCINSLFYERARDLEQSRMQNGLRFYQVERFSVRDDPGEEWWATVATREFSTPRIDDDGSLALAFNGLFDDGNGHFFGRFGAQGASGEEDDGTDSDEAVKVSVLDVTSGRIGLRVDTYWYGHGAAHGNYTIGYMHFLTEPLRELAVADVFAGAGWEEGLAELAVAELGRTLGDDFWSTAAEDMASMVADPWRWNFSDDGLILQFQPYDVAAYAVGAPTVTIPWSAIEPYLAEGASRR